MGKETNEINNKYGKLIVASRGPNTSNGSAQWFCRCECGNPELKLIRAGSLRSGTTKSCGCIQSEAMMKALNEESRLLARETNHVKRIGIHGIVELVGEYFGDNKRTLYRCLVHGEIWESTPTNMVQGHGLRCCQMANMSEVAERKKQLAEIRYLKKIEGLFEIKEPYKGKEHPILHFCIRHKELHLASPGQINKGSGLRCCGQEKLKQRAKAKRDKAAFEYDSKVARIGKAERMGIYISSDTPILHRCIEHGESHLSAPDNILQGGGLKCCFIFARDASLQRKSDAARKRLEDFCSNPNSRVELLGEYKGFHGKTLFRCKLHDRVYPAMPANILKGSGLLCCKRRGVDSLSQILEGTFQGAEKNEWLYLYELARFKDYLKFGISDTEYKRWETDKDQEYGEEVCKWWFDRRIEAYAVEEAIFYASIRHMEHPDELKEWIGYTEIRRIGRDQMVGLMQQMIDHLNEVGLWQFIVDQIPLTNEQRSTIDKIQAMQ